jgi:tRNA 5-methylaminomethyl-2-thiouridine biosynthesis bifunctional protein
LQRSRGQISFWRSEASSRLKLPLAGDGYAIAMPGQMLCGATRQEGDQEAHLRELDHRHNLDRLQRLTGLLGPATGESLEGRVGWRLSAEDRLPIAGAVPLLGQAATAITTTQTRLLPREPGLFVLTALGARGLTLAPLMGELVASQATGTPWPVEQDLVDAVDPGRWLVRQARRAT